MPNETKGERGPRIDAEAFRAVFDASPQGILVHRRHQPLYVNHAWSALHGYEPEEILARVSIADLISLEDRECMLAYNEDRLKGLAVPSRYHYQAVHRSGRLIWAEIFVQELDWHGEPAIQCTVIDVGHRGDAAVEMARRALDAQERFKQALDEFAEGFALFDDERRLIIWNRRFIEICPELDKVLKPGIRFEDIVRLRLELGLIEDAIGNEEAWLRQRLARFGDHSDSTDMRMTDGRWYQIQEKRMTDGCFLMSTIDVTERRRAEKTLAAERSLLRAIIDNIPDAIYAKDRQANFTLKNHFDAEFMGAKSTEETIGYSDFDYYPEDLARSFYEEDMRVIEHGDHIIAREQKVVRDDETVIWLSATKVPLKDADGQIIGLVGCSRDITEQKALALDLATYQDHLEEMVEERTAEIEQQKLVIEASLERERELSEAQRHFVSMVCHEFRTPLAIIDGNAQRIDRRHDSIAPDKLKAGMDKIRTSVRRLTELMESVLSAARLEAGMMKFEPESCSPTEMISDVCLNYGEINPTYRIDLDIGSLPELFLMDVKLMRQVFSNLISNAIKYSPNNPHVWVKGEASDDGAIMISVRDRGVGIPKAELEQLFARFFRASTSAGIAGTGIGLNMVKTVVEMHGGRIDVASEKGEGTTFTLHLPCLDHGCIEHAPTMESAGYSKAG